MYFVTQELETVNQQLIIGCIYNCKMALIYVTNFMPKCPPKIFQPDKNSLNKISCLCKKYTRFTVQGFENNQDM